MNVFFRDAITSSRVGPCHEKSYVTCIGTKFCVDEVEGGRGSQQNIHRPKYILFKNMTECQYFLTILKFHR
jgi:hypothetical protein